LGPIILKIKASPVFSGDLDSHKHTQKGSPKFNVDFVWIMSIFCYYCWGLVIRTNQYQLVSTSGLVVVVVVAVDKAASFSPLAVDDVSPFSFVLVSDLCDPDDEQGRSLSSGFGCINVNGNSATSSLKNKCAKS